VGCDLSGVSGVFPRGGGGALLFDQVEVGVGGRVFACEYEGGVSSSGKIDAKLRWLNSFGGLRFF